MGNQELQATHGQQPEKWHSINWAVCWRKVRSLQRRIVKALRAGQWRKVKRLSYLLVHSFAARALAVRRVTQNSGKKTPGVDGEIWNTPGKKYQAIKIIASWRRYRASPLKRIQVPKKDRKRTRPLSIPTMRDRARQAVYAQALSPIAETTGDHNSYGFRPKRRCADAIEQCFKVLCQKQGATFILDADIKGFFDNISLEWIEKNIPMNKKVLYNWLRCGFIEKGKLFPTTKGVPQGGIISPVISNMVLDGLEAKVRDHPYFQRKHSINYIRYADDIRITANNREILKEVIIPKVNAFLQERGIALSEEKTRITHLREGFDFLGQTIRKYQRKTGEPGKIQITPSKGSLKEIQTKVKKICQNSRGVSQERLIECLNPVLRGWANYHRHVICAKAFSRVDSYVWNCLYRWARRRHPDKTGKWITDRYFEVKEGSKWTFRDKATGKSLIRLQQTLKQQRHVKIRGEANPFAPEWDSYFEAREAKLKSQSVTEYQRKVLQKQKGRCPVCQQMIESEEEVDLHHLDGKHGNNKLNNVVFLHPNCHRQMHSSKVAKT